MAFLNLNNAEFIKSAASPEGFIKDALPSVVFAGKSNVGKSSVINKLLNRKNFARVGEAPGKTIHVNYFLIDRKAYFVDLPGYGYAKVAQSEKEKWGPMIEGYIQNSTNLKNIFVLLDIRHNPTSDDIMLINYLFHYNKPITVIATKADKLSRSAQKKAVKNLADVVGIGVQNVFTVSSSEKTGKREILDRIQQILEN